MLTRTSSMMCPFGAETVPNLIVYPSASEMGPRLQDITLSATANASGPLTLMTEIAPVPGTVAGAYIVSSFLIYMPMKNLVAKIQLYLLKSLKKHYLRADLPQLER